MIVQIDIPEDLIRDAYILHYFKKYKLTFREYVISCLTNENNRHRKEQEEIEQ